MARFALMPAACALARGVFLALGLSQMAQAAVVGPFVPHLPGTAQELASVAQELDRYLLPTGPWRAGDIPTIATEGPLRLTSWRLPDAADTLAVMQDLRAQVQAAGFHILFECGAEDCGGFDFRFGTRVLSEPDMHVDLGDYRFLSAERVGADGPLRLSLLVSRGAGQGYVQLAQAGGPPVTQTPPTADAGQVSLSTMSAPAAPPAPPPAPPPKPPLAGALAAGPVVVEGVRFAPARAVLQDPLPPDWVQLAEWLAQTPGQVLTLTGYTDTSGSPGANLRLSDARAQALRAALIAAGAPPAQVIAMGKGAENPIAPNTTADGRSKNRRVEATLTPTR